MLNDYAEQANALCPDSPFPTAVGRLDKQTSGLLLLTADGPLHELLLRPGLVPKVYDAVVRVRAPSVLTEDQLARLRHGCELSDGKARAEAVEVLESFATEPPPPARLRFGLGPGNRKRLQGTGETSPHAAAAARTAAAAAAGAIPIDHAYRLRVTMRIGRNRVVRRLLAAAGLPVFRLEREAFGPLHLCDLGEEFATTPGRLVMLSQEQQAALRHACAFADEERSIGPPEGTVVSTRSST